jgi:hypothetical protein
MYTLGTAAKACGVSKSTIHRAIRSGRISARSRDDNGYEIDPAELHRVFPPVSQEVTENSSEKGSAERSETLEGNGRNALHPDLELAVKLARAEASLEALKEIVELERKRAEELRAERDRWAGIAEASQRQITHLTTKPPEPLAVIPMPAPVPTPVVETPAAPRGWWPFRRAG